MDTATKLIDKHYSPMILRKFTHYGAPIYVAVISDDTLDDLDDEVLRFMEDNKENWSNNIQRVRDLAGGLTEHINNHYGRAEGVAVILYVDKMFVSSLHGDFMNHTSCRIELFGLLNASTGV